MGQPSFATTSSRVILRFGNNTLPYGAGTLAWQDLNDNKNWFFQPPGASGGFDYDNRQNVLSQFLYRATSAYLSDDWKYWKFTIPIWYTESTAFGGSATPLGSQIATLAQAGEQYLTTDNLTGILVKFNQVRNRKVKPGVYPPFWEFDLEFIAKAPWFTDLSSSGSLANLLDPNGGFEL